MKMRIYSSREYFLHWFAAYFDFSCPHPEETTGPCSWLLSNNITFIFFFSARVFTLMWYVFLRKERKKKRKKLYKSIFLGKRISLSMDDLFFLDCIFISSNETYNWAFIKLIHLTQLKKNNSKLKDKIYISISYDLLDW